VLLVKKKNNNMDKEVELEVDLNTSFEIPIDEIICNEEDYDDWDYLEEWEQVNIHNSQNKFF
jgi:hypothetical protein